MLNSADIRPDVYVAPLGHGLLASWNSPPSAMPVLRCVVRIAGFAPELLGRAMTDAELARLERAIVTDQAAGRDGFVVGWQLQRSRWGTVLGRQLRICTDGTELMVTWDHFAQQEGWYQRWRGVGEREKWAWRQLMAGRGGDAGPPTLHVATEVFRATIGPGLQPKSG